MSAEVPSTSDDRIRLSDEEIAVLTDFDTFDDGHISVLNRPYRLIRHVGSGFKGVVWKVQDEYGAFCALKLTTGEDYADKSVHAEAVMRSVLPSPIFTRLLATDKWTTSRLPDTTFVVTLEDWVEGVTLKDFIADPNELTIETLKTFGRGMCAALRALQSAGLVHDDLHAKNVMLRRLSPGEGMQYGMYEDQVWTVVVVDTGSLKKFENAKKDRDDVGWVAHHLVQIHNQLRRRRNLTQTHLRYLRSVLELVETMVDSEPTRAVRSADDIYRQLERAYSNALAAPKHEPQLSHPFDFLSAERIADDELLIRLFTDVPWMTQVAGPDPILLTGPRGCGKSMLFRWLGLRTHLANNRVIPKGPDGITGIYVSCTTELQNRFFDLDTADLASTHRADIVHYFNMLLARELLITLDHIQRHDKLGETYGIGFDEQREIMEFVLARIEPTSTNLQGTAQLRIAISAIEREMFQCHLRLMRGEEPVRTTTTSFLGELTAKVAGTVHGMTQRPIVFLLDDFSTHRVPEHVQRVLGPVVWERRPSHVFKISSEKNGVIFDYQDGKATADASRERVEIDCGKEYIDLSSRNAAALNAAERFAHDLLATRLKLSNWAGTPENLIGESPDYTEWVNGLRNSSKAPLYYGMRTISELCSGDIATLLMIYRRILDGCSADQTEQITPSAQSRAIWQVSNELLYNLSPHRPLGPTMLSLASAFAHFTGQAVKGRLMDGRPRECPRIEVDQGAESKTDLDPKLQELLDELLRRSVFIELEPSRSRRSQVATLRLHIRRIYMPAFRGPLRKNVAVKFTPSRFEDFLKDPVEQMRIKLNAVSDPTLEPPGDDGLLHPSLFDDREDT